MSKDRELPYEFDLIFDLKNMSEVESIAKGDYSHNRATPEKLIELFIDLKLDIPECLQEIHKSKQTIWILPDGTWIDYAPLENEHPDTRKIVISRFKK
jgi:hypothetical protein